MALTDDEVQNKRYLLALYRAGDYRRLCEDYCHEGWYAWIVDGEVREGGICSFQVAHLSEEDALARVATHIYGQLLQDALGC
jgi:hypothetical protein